MAGLRLIVGLGNPGVEHLRTRHNAGFWLVDALAQREGARFGVESKVRGETAKIVIGGQPLWLLKPATFMNASGASVGAALRYWKIEAEEMLVVHDDLDLPPGAARLKFDGGTAARTDCATCSRTSATGDSIACASALVIRATRIASPVGCSGDHPRWTNWQSSKQSRVRSMCCRLRLQASSTRR